MTAPVPRRVFLGWSAFVGVGTWAALSPTSNSRAKAKPTTTTAPSCVDAVVEPIPEACAPC